MISPAKGMAAQAANSGQSTTSSLDSLSHYRESAAHRPHSPVPRELADGQRVIVTARWILVAAGLLLTLWNPRSVQDLRVHILLLLLLAVGNFYLHAQLRMQRAAVAWVAYTSSAADILAITMLLVAQGGATSHLYIFYFPALLACSVAFSPTVVAAFSGAAMVLYASTALPVGFTEAELQAVLIRVLMFAAVATCGGAFRRIEHERYHASLAAVERLAAHFEATRPSSM
jgi:hypothetical protein